MKKLLTIAALTLMPLAAIHAQTPPPAACDTCDCEGLTNRITQLEEEIRILSK